MFEDICQHSWRECWEKPDELWRLDCVCVSLYIVRKGERDCSAAAVNRGAVPALAPAQTGTESGSWYVAGGWSERENSPHHLRKPGHS